MRYRPDYPATSRFLIADSRLRRALHVAAEEIETVVEVIAPYREGNYLESLSIGNGETTDRMSVNLSVDDPAGAPVEFGNTRTDHSGRHILTRAAEIAGFNVDVGG